MWPILLALLPWTNAHASDTWWGRLGLTGAYAPYDGIGELMEAGALDYADQNYRPVHVLAGPAVGFGAAKGPTWFSMTWMRRRTAATSQAYTVPNTGTGNDDARMYDTALNFRANAFTFAGGVGMDRPNAYIGLGAGLHIQRHRINTRVMDSWSAEPDEVNFSFGNPSWAFAPSIEARIVTMDDSESVIIALEPYYSLRGLSDGDAFAQQAAYEFGATFDPNIDVRTPILGMTVLIIPNK